MRGLSLAAALGCLSVAAPAAAQDVVHQQVQSFLDVLKSGGDFANSEFKGAVKAGDIPRLRALADCDLDSVKRSQSGTSAVVVFTCPAASGKTSTGVLMLISAGKAIAIEPMSYVQVPERG